MLSLYIGKKNILDGLSDEDQLSGAKKSFEEILQVPSLAFLMGAGCSAELGIPLMSGFAEIIHEIKNKTYKELVRLYLGEERKIKPEEIEPFLGYLYRMISIGQSKTTEVKGKKETTFKHNNIKIGSEDFLCADIQTIIDEIKGIFYKKCANIDDSKLLFHKLFIKKILSRDPNQSLDRIKLFITNYDLALEKTCDLLGVSYFNGFTGNLVRKFNPSAFGLDMHYRNNQSSKMRRHDKVLDIVKLHGSINWFKDSSSEYNIEETCEKLQRGEVMIYPTPLKVESSLDMPYSELFRLFYSTIINPGTTLIVIGYNFGDDHINELILQALTIPSFRLVILKKPSDPAVKSLFDLDDPRIWFLSGEYDGGNKYYNHFGSFVTKILPAIDNEAEKIEEKILEIKKAKINSEKDKDSIEC